MNLLVTGGAGYIGSHTCLELLKQNHNITVVDNLSNSSEESLRRVQQITGKKLSFYKVDLLDRDALNNVLQSQSKKIDAVIHFAGFKAVGESVQRPLWYYQNNVQSTLNLCEVMDANGVRNIIFSSSCTVYGNPDVVPVHEDLPLSGTNPYGRSKVMVEQVLNDIYQADNRWNIGLLRYFNPIGAHESGQIGEDPLGIPNNLLPYISQVAIGKLKQLTVFGGDYSTADGSCVRDYIHVVDLAVGHVKALEKLEENPGVVAYNLGTGQGYSVLEVIAAFEKVTGEKVPHIISGRRSGDAAECYGNPEKAKMELSWQAERSIEDMCRDTWRWQKANPNGYC
ncbi:UDP-glucose 4-epimerase GalE [Desulfopila sp. IMCC35008]|uniref:UDP-glucose 4-epimerase GalE n=1 Tax=Desulfopila sp. IMCC35008 TaxID=2653858 RepID=UPI0013D54F1F|nr:UDP-glucose 4-epimerase GalE [Desulfopila sp. IMCC35008]